MIRFFEGIGNSIGIALARMEAEEEIQNLAKFPSENPNPVMRIAKDGVLLYANGASDSFLEEWGCETGQPVGEEWRRMVLDFFTQGSEKRFEIEHAGRTFSFMAAAIPEANYVNLYGRDITERKLVEEDLRQYRHRLEELVQKRTTELTEVNKQLLKEIEGRKSLEKEILNVSEREQRRIGQELHDSLGQQLTGIAFMIKVLERKLASGFPEEADNVAGISNLVNQATEQARGLAKGLVPIDLEAGTLQSALQELATTTQNLFGVSCTLEYEEGVEVENPEVAVHIYRIAQEAVTNAVKHGRTKNIQIQIAYNKDKSVLTVENDGIDFPKEFEARGTGMGLQIMDHRVDIIGGTFDITKRPKGGTIMTCTFPNKKH
jgi:signal transduction histidine kinase